MQLVYDHGTNSYGEKTVKPVRVELSPVDKDGDSHPALAQILVNARMVPPVYMNKNQGFALKTWDKNAIIVDLTRYGTLPEETAREIGEKAQQALTDTLTEAVSLINMIDLFYREGQLGKLSENVKRLEDRQDRHYNDLTDRIARHAEDSTKRLDLQRADIAKLWGMLQPREDEPVKVTASQRMGIRARGSWLKLTKRVKGIIRRPSMRLKVEAYDD